ncbi:MAG: fumarylacetoacetate hydrolase [Verrucomicrobiae bacterium]|nr:fumarylacetoacetate hydrolase [Verrucomicrobiae bacterium]
MKLVRFSARELVKSDSDAFYRLGIWEDKSIFDLTEVDPNIFGSIGQWLQQDDPCAAAIQARASAGAIHVDLAEIYAPVDFQEVWAAGVTYFRSREARMEESKDAGGGTFYDRVYSAPRPELFFKSTPERVVGPGGEVRIRRDSKWNVPEPELTLVISPAAKLVGFTIGNDMSSRDIEGENPLYLPQAKVYRGSCAIGPAILLASAVPDPKKLSIQLGIKRGVDDMFEGEISISQLKRPLEELIRYLTCENDFPNGVLLMTGTGIVPPDNVSLQPGDVVEITIPEIGTLSNTVAVE